MQAPTALKRKHSNFRSLRDGDTIIGDEMVRIRFPRPPDGTGKVIEMTRSSLLRSPVMARLIESSHYLEGCYMILTFPNDSAICFEIVKNYLEDGSDRFTDSRLRAYLLARYKLIDRFLIHIRVYKMAKKLDLAGLMAIAYECLEQAERLMSPTRCVTMTRIIFGVDSGFDKRIKDWCMKHVGFHFAVLYMTKEWNELIPHLDPDFQGKWAKLIDENITILTAIQDEADDQALAEVMNGMEFSHRRGAVSAIRKPANEMSFEEVIRGARSGSKDQPYREDWEDIEPQNPKEPKAGDGKKENVKPRMFKWPRRTTSLVPTHISMPFTHSAKAMEVMGINQDADKKGKKRKTGYRYRLRHFWR